MTEETKSYLLTLKKMHDELQDEYERAVFFYACCAFQEHARGRWETKYVTKSQLLDYLCRVGLAHRRADGKLPDDRKLRETARELLAKGYPLLASSKVRGYFIAASLDEIDAPERENHARALATLAVGNGYKRVRSLLSGQGRLF